MFSSRKALAAIAAVAMAAVPAAASAAPARVSAKVAKKSKVAPVVIGLGALIVVGATIAIASSGGNNSNSPG